MPIADDTIRWIYEGTFGCDQLEVEVLSIDFDRDHPGGRRVRGRVLDPKTGQQVGDFERRIYEHYGSLEVFNSGLEIEPRYQGRGFASEFGGQVNVRLKEQGVRCIRLVAGRNAGGRAWAKLFDFDVERLSGFGAGDRKGGPTGVGIGAEDVVLPESNDENELRRAIVRALVEASFQRRDITAGERGELLDHVDQMLTPMALASLDHGLAEALLEGARWPGIRVLEE